MTEYKTPWMDEELTLLQDSVRKFYENEMVPQEETWQAQGYVDKEFWKTARGRRNFMCLSAGRLRWCRW